MFVVKEKGSSSAALKMLTPKHTSNAERIAMVKIVKEVDSQKILEKIFHKS